MFADTGPLYALTDSSDQYHERAGREFRGLSKQGRILALSYPVVLECYNLLYQNVRLSVAHEWLELAIQDSKPLNPTPEDYRDAALQVRRFADQRVSLVDAALAVLAVRFGVPVWTFDSRFAVMRVPVWQA